MSTIEPIPFAVDLTVRPDVRAFFDKQTNTISYVVSDPQSDACAIFDSVMDFNYATGEVAFDQAEEIIAYVRKSGRRVEWLIETHVHADHLSAAPYLQDKLGGRIGIGEGIRTVQDTFGKVFNMGTEFQRDGSQFDRLFRDGDSYQIGDMVAHTLSTPGHTPADMVHVVGDAAFAGDTLFMPDSGSARADFPGGDARTLYRSIQRILALPDEVRLFVCHDYGPNGRDIAWETTIGEQRKTNIHVGPDSSEDEFVRMREARDKTLSAPRLIIPSLQVNMRAGQMPPKESDGRIYLKVPIGGILPNRK